MAESVIQESDKSVLIDIFVWFFLVCGILGVIAQTTTKLAVRRGLGPEDYLILLSLVFAIAQSACVGIQISHGLGKSLSTLDTVQREHVFQAEYAGHFFFMICLCMTKLSPIVFIKSLVRVKSYKYIVYGLVTLTLLWTVSSVLVLSFQCHLPQTWNYLGNSCIDRKSFWNYYGALNIATDLAPIILMIILASRIQTSFGRKCTVAGVFASRIVVVAAVCCQLYFLNTAMPTTDPTLDLWPMWICTQLVQALAILTACIPYLKPFMDSLESGGFRADDLRRRRANGYGYYYRDTNNSYKIGTKTTGAREGRSSRLHNHGDDFGQHSDREGSHELGNLNTSPAQIGNGVRVEAGVGSDWEDDGNSQSSQTRIIKETRTFTVDVETRM